MKISFDRRFFGALLASRLLEVVGVGLLAMPLGEILEKSRFTDLEFEEAGGQYLFEFLRFLGTTHVSRLALFAAVVGSALLLLRAPIEFFATFPEGIPGKSVQRLSFAGKRILLRFVLTLAQWGTVGVTGYLAFARTSIETNFLPRLVILVAIVCIAKTLGLFLEFSSAEGDVATAEQDDARPRWLGRNAASSAKRVTIGFGLSVVEILGAALVLALCVAPAEKRALSAVFAEGVFLALIALRLVYLRSLVVSSER